ncbi:MAG TPA: glutathione binding-like protein [Trichocoleus sp.]
MFTPDSVAQKRNSHPPTIFSTGLQRQRRKSHLLKALKPFGALGPKKIAQLNTQIEPMLDHLAQQLSQSDWLCGSAYSLADAVWTAVLNRLEELGFGPLWQEGRRSAIASYLHRLKARPSYSAAIQNDTMPVPMVLAGLRRIFLRF